jgi:hypothetical protein
VRKISRNGLIKKVDAAFSVFVRKNYADEHGNVKCFTCEKIMPWKESQAGHWIKRGHASVRWDERNVKPQCPRCNLWLNGAQDAFAVALLNEYGPDTLEELMRLKHTAKRWRIPELRELLEQYTEATE